MIGLEDIHPIMDVLIDVVPLVLVGITQLAAIYGKPKIIASVKPIAKLWDYLSGNYRNAVCLERRSVDRHSPVKRVADLPPVPEPLP